MKYSNIDQLRIYAAVTGILLVAVWFAMTWARRGDADLVAMLATGVAGFELFFFGQDMQKRWRRSRG